MITHPKHSISRSEGYLFCLNSPLRTKLLCSDAIAQSNPPASGSKPAFAFYQKEGSQQSNLAPEQLQIVNRHTIALSEVRQKVFMKCGIHEEDGNMPIPLFGRESKRTYVGRQPS